MSLKLFDHLLNPVIVVDKSANIIYYNHICSTYFKLPPRKLKKLKSISDLLVGHNSTLLKNIETALENKTPVVSKEIEINLPEILEVSQTVILKFIPVEGQVIIHVWDFSIEKHLHEKYKKQIIELRETHDQIMKSDKLSALGELIAGIGHEISNPLTILSDRIYRMEENLLTNNSKELSKNIKDMDHGIKRINKIIANLQSFVKNQDEQLEVISLKKAIQESESFIKDLNILKEIKLNIDIKDDCFMLGNEIKIQQVIINLIKNSIDALHSIKSPQININLFNNTKEKTSCLKISDNGAGIPSDMKDKLFEMFSTSKEFGEGTGLGLSISQKIIDSYHGSIVLEEREQGASFKIDLPYLDFSSFSQTNDYLNGDKDGEDKKVLIVANSDKDLNQIYQSLENANIVLILTNNFDKIQDLISFYNVDAVGFLGQKFNLEKDEYHDYEVIDLSLLKDLKRNCLIEAFNLTEDS